MLDINQETEREKITIFFNAPNKLAVINNLRCLFGDAFSFSWNFNWIKGFGNFF